MRPGLRSPCFLTDTSLTLAEIISELAARNTTVDVATTSDISLDGTAEPLTWEEADARKEANPALRRFCRGAKLIDARPLTTLPTDLETRDRVLSTIDAKITIATPVP